MRAQEINNIGTWLVKFKETWVASQAKQRRIRLKLNLMQTSQFGRNHFRRRQTWSLWRARLHQRAALGWWAQEHWKTQECQTLQYTASMSQYFRARGKKAVTKRLAHKVESHSSSRRFKARKAFTIKEHLVNQTKPYWTITNQVALNASIRSKLQSFSVLGHNRNQQAPASKPKWS